jgi:hypothetical protein
MPSCSTHRLSTGRVRQLTRQHAENSIHLSLISSRLHLEMDLYFFFREILVWSNEDLNILWRGSHSMARTAVLNRRVEYKLGKGALWGKILGRIRKRSTDIQNFASQHQINSTQHVLLRNLCVGNSSRVINPSLQIGRVDSIHQRLNILENEINNHNFQQISLYLSTHISLQAAL